MRRSVALTAATARRDYHGVAEMQQVTVAVAANCPVGKYREPQPLNLLQITSGTGGDQSDSTKSLISRTHDLPKYGRGWRIVQILDDDHSWSVQPLKQVELLAE